MMIFRVYPSYVFAPISLTVLFSVLFCWFLISAIQQAKKTNRRKNLLLRTMIALMLPSIMILTTLFVALYMHAKQIEVDDHSLIIHSLFNRKEIAWKDIASVDGNFTLTTRLGLINKNSYAWMDVRTRSGEIIHISLRFLANTRRLEDFVRKKIPE